jgi:hypothetical protein
MTAMSADLTPIASKLCNLVRMLSSNQDGEIIAAARAIGRTLAGHGLDFHALADNIGEANGKKFTEADAAEIIVVAWRTGNAKPRTGQCSTMRTSMQNRHGMRSLSNVQPVPTDCATIASGTLSWAWFAALFMEAGSVKNKRRGCAQFTHGCDDEGSPLVVAVSQGWQEPALAGPSQCADCLAIRSGDPRCDWL